MTEPITLSAEGYDELAIILRDAFLQASEGKGAERHANSKPFHEQPMQSISDLFDSDKGMAFQIVKKLREGLDMPEYERLERELLGVIVYTAGAILWHKRRRVALGLTPRKPFDWEDTEPDPEPPSMTNEQAAQALRGIAESEDVRMDNITATATTGRPKPTCPGCGRGEGHRHRRGCTTRWAELAESAPKDDPFAGAPEWAKYKAQDADGDWYWYKNRPEQTDGIWMAEDGLHDRELRTHIINPNWRETLIERPTK